MIKGSWQNKVSIIIPAYNAACYITDAIHSALRQSYENIEVIIVDDGSTDETREIVAGFRDARLSYVYQENRGQSAAINHAVNRSSGEYIKLLDADDWMNARHIESQVRTLDGSQNSVATCRWGYFVSDFTRPSVSKEQTDKDYTDPMQWLLDSFTQDEGMVGGWRWLIPRDIWDKTGGYDESLTLYNDVHFSTKLLLVCREVRFATDAVYSYRRGVSTSMSVDQSRKTMESVYSAICMSADLIRRESEAPEFCRIYADRLKMWCYRFYPEFPDLVAKAEGRVAELGGSDCEMNGGRLLRAALPIVGWKGVRRLQQFAYRFGWRVLIRHKSEKILRQFN